MPADVACRGGFHQNFAVGSPTRDFHLHYAGQARAAPAVAIGLADVSSSHKRRFSVPRRLAPLRGRAFSRRAIKLESRVPKVYAPAGKVQPVDGAGVLADVSLLAIP